MCPKCPIVSLCGQGASGLNSPSLGGAGTAEDNGGYRSREGKTEFTHKPRVGIQLIGSWFSGSHSFYGINPHAGGQCFGYGTASAMHVLGTDLANILSRAFAMIVASTWVDIRSMLL